MKILLINPPWQRFFGVSLSTPAIALNHIAAYIEKELPWCAIDVYDADQSGEVSFSFDNSRYAYAHQEYVKRLKDRGDPVWDEVRQVIRDFGPDVVGVSAMTATYCSALEVSRIAKEWNPDVPVVFGGYHPSALPEDTLRNKSVDYVVIGEGEVTFRELLLNLRNPAEVPGIAYRNGDGNATRTPERPPIENINELPIPVFEYSMHKNDYGRSRGAGLYRWYLVGARGCPFQCTYCASSKVVRYRSLEHIMREVGRVREKHGIDQFFFMDDSFSLIRSRALELCGLLKKSGVKWRCNTRVDLVDEEMVSIMKESGCLSTSVGIETGSPKTMKMIRKNIQYDKVREALGLFQKYEITVAGFFIIGFPWETRGDMDQTLNLIRELPLDDFQLNIATPLPGTQLFQSLVDAGKIDVATEDWSRYQQGSPYMNYSSCPDEEWSRLMIDYIGKASRLYRKKKMKRILHKLLHDPGRSARIAAYLAGKMLGFRSSHAPF